MRIFLAYLGLIAMLGLSSSIVRAESSKARADDKKPYERHRQHQEGRGQTTTTTGARKPAGSEERAKQEQYKGPVNPNKSGGAQQHIDQE